MTSSGPAGAAQVELLANAAPDMVASCQAAHLWLRLHVRQVCTCLLGPRAGEARYRQLEREGLPSFTVTVAPLYEKAQGSMGVAFAASMSAALVERGLRRDVGVMGELDVQGGLLPVGGVLSKAKALARVGVKKLLVARGSLRAEQLLAVRGCVGEVVECGDVWQVLRAVFPPPPRQQLPGAAPAPHEGEQAGAGPGWRHGHRADGGGRSVPAWLAEQMMQLKPQRSRRCWGALTWAGPSAWTATESSTACRRTRPSSTHTCR